MIGIIEILILTLRLIVGLFTINKSIFLLLLSIFEIICIIITLEQLINSYYK